MPNKPFKPCRSPSCANLTRDGYCDTHKKQPQEYDRYRGNSTARGYDARWRKVRITYLRRHPLCVECQKEGRVTPAIVVDHIKPHKGDMNLFWDETNWQPMCKSHHDIKTAREDGGFSNNVKERRQ